MTRLDVLSGFEQLPVATAYDLNGERIHHLPADVADFACCNPVYENLEGWDGDLRKARSLQDLPLSAQRYLEFISDHTKTPIAILSIGPDRDETIVLRPDLIWG